MANPAPWATRGHCLAGPARRRAEAACLRGDISLLNAPPSVRAASSTAVPKTNEKLSEDAASKQVGPCPTVQLDALRERVRKVLAPVPCSNRIGNELREFWQSRLDLERQAECDRKQGVALPPQLRGWRGFARSLWQRPVPLKLTGYYLSYSTGVTLPIYYVHYHQGMLTGYAVDYYIEAFIESLVQHSNLFQGVTGFLASALFLMLSFRVHRASSRWWEGSHQWGNLMSAVRSLSLTAQLSMTNKCTAAEVGLLAYAHARCLEFHLRHEGDEKLRELFGRLLSKKQLEDLLKAPQRPLWVLQFLTLKCADAHDVKEVKNVRLLVAMMVEVQHMVKITQELQRIQSTREPWSYQRHMRLTTQFWLGVLPLAIMPPLQFVTPFFCGIIGYVVYKLDDVSVELMNPFGYDRSDLPICLINERLRAEIEHLLMVYLAGSTEKRRRELFEALGCEAAPT
mmetsp:Transcript_55837/g.103340  ORF Transcript_55837/g.103340 Transcript_55837/m.103340 type:complete len:455 (+) Transcript_55837:41-1405(+)